MGTIIEETYDEENQPKHNNENNELGY